MTCVCRFSDCQRGPDAGHEARIPAHSPVHGARESPTGLHER